MRHWKVISAAVAFAAWLAVAGLAQSVGRVSGTVKDENGKPWPGVTVTIVSPDSGMKFTLKTDDRGHYSQVGMPAGVYIITVETDKYPPQQFPVRLEAGGQVQQDIDFKDLLAKNPELAEAMKKRAAAQQQFTQLKQHFEAGRKAMDQIDALRQQIATEPAAQQAATQQQISQLSQTAAAEFEQAQKVAGPTNSNLPTILGNLGLAYEMAGQHEKAAAAFNQAVQLKPADPNFLLGAATNMAYAGKTQDASADCEKATAISAPTGATCWRNLGVVLYNTNHLQESVVPLQKAAQADPSNPDTWYLLGNALMNTMQSKMVDGKLTAVVNPGTVAAYQKYLQLAPTGPHASDVQQTLQALQQLGAGVDIKFVNPKEEKKKKH